jgi:hypothetical protein
MVVHCRQAGVSTAMAISAVAGALKGNDALYVAFKPQVSNRFIEICEAVASSLDAPNSRPTKDSLKVCGGWVYTASPGSLRAEPVDHVMIDNADYTLSGYHEYKTLERRADRVTLAMNGCTENWQNDIRDECVELRYSWTEVSAWTNDRIKHHAESMSRQAFRKEFGAPIENHREDTE